MPTNRQHTTDAPSKPSPPASGPLRWRINKPQQQEVHRKLSQAPPLESQPLAENIPAVSPTLPHVTASGACTRQPHQRKIHRELSQAPPLERQPPAENIPAISPTLPRVTVSYVQELLNRSWTHMFTAKHRFPPKVDERLQISSLTRYLRHMKSKLDLIPCASCDLSADLSSPVRKDDELLIRFWKAHCDKSELANDHLNWLNAKAMHSNDIPLCSDCYQSIQQLKIPKFSSLNNINVFHRYPYPMELSGLSWVEESLIALHHPTVAVQKLIPWLESSYRGLRGHTICIPQDPTPLLRILPDPKLVYENIKVIWCGRDKPSDSDLGYALRVRRRAVLKALKWLLQHNRIYKAMYDNQSLILNEDAISSLPEDGVPPELLAEASHCPDISLDRGGIAESIEEYGVENDLQAAQLRAGGLASSGCVYSDTEADRVIAELVHINTLHKHLSDKLDSDQNSENNVSRKRKRGAESDLQAREDDPHHYLFSGSKAIAPVERRHADYFAAAFPTLYPYGTGGPYQDRRKSVSLKSYAQWSLSRSDPNFARHISYTYLVFDQIVLSEASIANYLRLKSQDPDEIAARIGRLSLEILEQSSRECEKGKPISNPDVAYLLREIKAIGQRVTCGYNEKLRWRAEIRGLIIEFGIPLYWITITPSDLHNPIVIKYTNRESINDFLARLETEGYGDLQASFATANPSSIAKFFWDTCEGILEKLIAANSSPQVGILGPMRAHYGVVESNGRGMLHLHCFIWADGGYRIPELWTSMRDQEKTGMQEEMIRYAESVIREHIPAQASEPETSIFQADMLSMDVRSSWPRSIIEAWSREVALKFQMHSQSHTQSCRKYGTACRYNFPRELVAQTHVEDGVVKLKRDNGYVNSYNPILAIALMSNQDIQLVSSTVTRTLSALYYMCCYSTKDDAKAKDLVAQAIFLQKSIEETNRSHAAEDDHTRTQYLNAAKFAMRCHNRLAYRKEQPGPMSAYRLMGFPGRITNCSDYANLNLNVLVSEFARYVPHRGSDLSLSGEDQDVDCVIAGNGGSIQKPRFIERYYHRGDRLSYLTFYDYIKFVTHEHTKQRKCIPYKKPPKHFAGYGQIIEDVQPRHLRLYGTLKPQISGNSGQELTEDGDEEYAAAVKLALFVPWSIDDKRLCDLAPTYQECLRIITQDIRQYGMRSLRSEQYLLNLELLQRSASDADWDAKTRQQPMANPPQGGESQTSKVAKSGPSDTQKISYYLTLQKNGRLSAREEDALIRTINRPEISLIRDADPSDMIKWKVLSSKSLSFSSRQDVDEGRNGTSRPFLATFEEVDDELKQKILRNHRGNLLFDLVQEKIPLNQKQGIVFKMVMRRVLFPEKVPTPLRLYIAGVGGTGKSQILKAIRCACEMLGYSHFIKYMAPTGMAADVIGGSTWHSALGINPVSKEQGDRSEEPSHRKGPSKGSVQKLNALQRAWREVRLAVIDEIGMVSSADLSQIDQKLQALRTRGSSSDHSFGSIRVFLALGDFCQFSPINGSPLYGGLRKGDKHPDTSLWPQFNKVIILDKSMRQIGEPVFQGLLQRARDGSLTDQDVYCLNQRTVDQTCRLISPPGVDFGMEVEAMEAETATTGLMEYSDAPGSSSSADPMVAIPISTKSEEPIDCFIIQTHSLKKQINWMKIQELARQTRQKVCIFLSNQISNDASNPSWSRMASVDGESEGSLACLPIVKGMRAMCTINTSQEYSVINGTLGTVTGVVTSQTGYDIGDNIILFPRPPEYIIFKPDAPKCLLFAGLEAGEWPLAPFSTAITNKKTGTKSFTRWQTRVVPAWAITDYKAQGQTYNNIVVDLQKKGGFTGPKHYASVYVQLSRCRSLCGLHLLRPVKLSDLNEKPPAQLAAEFERLSKLQVETLASWEQEERDWLTGE